VAVFGHGSFTKTGGIIYGNYEKDLDLRNTVKADGMEQTNRGAAVYRDASYRRETTVGAEQNLSASYSYSSNRWTYTGQWED
jgi:hypothetical protein